MVFLALGDTLCQQRSGANGERETLRQKVRDQAEINLHETIMWPACGASLLCPTV